MENTQNKLSPKLIVAFLLTAILFGAGGFYLGKTSLMNAAPPPPPPVAEATPSPTPDPSAPQYPVPAPPSTASGTVPNNSPEAQPPPANLDVSDEPLDRWLGDVIGQDRIESLFGRSDLLRRFVKTVDNATEGKIPSMISLFKPLNDDFKVDEAADGATLSPSNYSRYTAYVDLLTSVDERQLLKIYVHYYGLIQTAFKEIGMDGYFNDRLVGAIDSAIAAPDVDGPVKLVKDGYYKFVDPKFEALTAAQKAMIRMGPANASRVKAKLKTIRQRLTHLNIAD